MLGLGSVLLAGGRDIDGGDQRHLGIGDGRRELEPSKRWCWLFAAVTHLRSHDRDDPVGARAAVQPRHAVIVDVEVLADQLAQQPVRVSDLLVVEQPVRALDGLQPRARARRRSAQRRSHAAASGRMSPSRGRMRGASVLSCADARSPLLACIPLCIDLGRPPPGFVGGDVALRSRHRVTPRRPASVGHARRPLRSAERPAPRFGGRELARPRRDSEGIGVSRCTTTLSARRLPSEGGHAMTHACCPDCRLRVITASPADALSCPGCRQPIVRTTAAESIGCRLVNVHPPPLSAALAAAVALRVPPGPRL